MTRYTVRFDMPAGATPGRIYREDVDAEDASDAFNQAFQVLVDRIETDYPDRATRPAPMLAIVNQTTHRHEFPDPLRIKAYQQRAETTH